MVKVLVLFISLFLSYASKFSVSGISSGGFMAVQMHVAYSASVEGAGIVAGGPYFCTKGSLEVALTACTVTPQLLDLKICEQYTKDQSNSGGIDSISNLPNTKVWVYSGQKDSVVVQKVGKDLATYYSNFGVNISTRFDIPSEHGWVTDNYGVGCDVFESPYIINCHLDAAGLILKNTYGDDLVSKPMIMDNLKTFNQTAYADTKAHMDSTGFVYIPTACQNSPASCLVHISFHGCHMGQEFIGNTFAAHSGLNEWAEGNNIIVIYPQIKEFVLNTHGCWDFWGYTGKDYLLKAGLQMQASYKMAQNPPVTQEVILSEI